MKGERDATCAERRPGAPQLMAARAVTQSNEARENMTRGRKLWSTRPGRQATLSASGRAHAVAEHHGPEAALAAPADWVQVSGAGATPRFSLLS